MAKRDRTIDYAQRQKYSDARQRVGLTYAQIATRLGVTPGPVSDWINGTAAVPPARIGALEATLGIGTPAQKAKPKSATKSLAPRFDTHSGTVPQAAACMKALRRAVEHVDAMVRGGELLPVSETDIVTAIVCELYRPESKVPVFPYLHLDAALSESESENEKVDIVWGQAFSTRNSIGGVSFTGRRYVQSVAIVCEVKIIAGKQYATIPGRIAEDIIRVSDLLERHVLEACPNAKGVVVVADPGDYFARHPEKKSELLSLAASQPRSVEFLLIGPYPR
jgi:DNA-binding transcriptional regulator YdaS (Cro superfamily)